MDAIEMQLSDKVSSRGLMLVLSSPSGAGKTSISRQLLASEDKLHLSVSATSRPLRGTEREGYDYFFVSEAEFQTMIGNQEFYEHAKVFGNYYGTPRAKVEELLSAGLDVMLDVDWQGTKQIKMQASDDLVSVFILPPSIAALEERLVMRGRDTAEVVAQRMQEANKEISHYTDYDYVIINDDLASTVKEVQAILQAERLRRQRRVGLPDFVKSLQDSQ